MSTWSLVGKFKPLYFLHLPSSSTEAARPAVSVVKPRTKATCF